MRIRKIKVAVRCRIFFLNIINIHNLRATLHHLSLFLTAKKKKIIFQLQEECSSIQTPMETAVDILITTNYRNDRLGVQCGGGGLFTAHGPRQIKSCVRQAIFFWSEDGGSGGKMIIQHKREM